MKPPQRVFGFPAHWQAGVAPRAVADLDIAGFHVRALRWECSDVRVEGLEPWTDGHLISFVVLGGGEERSLSQQGSVFYQEEGFQLLTSLEKKFKQGDGVSAPKWHKSYRHWPVAGSVSFEFVGQGYFDTQVAYLFRHQSSNQLAIFTDEINRQDAEEHYADEERRG